MSDVLNTVQELKNKQVEYDGSKYSRESVGNMVGQYRQSHQDHVKDLRALKEEHVKLAKQMNDEIAEQRSLMDEFRTMVSGKKGATSRGFKGVLSRIPLLGRPFRQRPLKDLLEAKVEIADLRCRESASYLERVETTMGDLRADLEVLHQKQLEAARKKTEFVDLVLSLKAAREDLERELAGIEDHNSEEYRSIELGKAEVERLIWENGQKMRLFDNAQDRIETVIKMNNNFLEISGNLHSNMTIIYEAAQTVLDELRQHVSSLATLAEAGELSLNMTESMESLKESMSRVATIASETSLYLTKNMESIVDGMRIYDEKTEELVEKNLAEERESKKEQLERILAKAVEERDKAPE
ncbi:hypothetical protein KKF84_17795 [Myxococcota bacterium]|nr:hypothetical protein [Myxococcota bacterium]MBU1537174.1 hypothetical protein [Myxococcota bacterium]